MDSGGDSSSGNQVDEISSHGSMHVVDVRRSFHVSVDDDAEEGVFFDIDQYIFIHDRRALGGFFRFGSSVLDLFELGVIKAVLLLKMRLFHCRMQRELS